MEIQSVIFLLKNAIITTLKLAAPMLIGAIISGFAVALFQATTQINEPTLVFAIKLVVVLVILIVFCPNLVEIMRDYTFNLYQSILQFVL